MKKSNQPKKRKWFPKTSVEYMAWMAEHLAKFEPGFGSASMVFIDTDGVEKTVRYAPGNEVPLLRQLKGCIREAIKIDEGARTVVVRKPRRKKSLWRAFDPR